MRIRARLFAIQRELAGTREVGLELAAGATIEDAWRAVAERFPVLAPGRPSLRFARNGAYADPDERLAEGDELAIIPPVSGGARPMRGGAGLTRGADAPTGGGDAGTGGADAPSGGGETRTSRILELRQGPLTNAVLAELADRLATDDDGAVVGFIGRTRRSPGTPAPGQEAEAARHAGRDVETLAYEALEPMVLAILGQIADEIAERFGVERMAIVHRTGEVPLGEPSVAVVAVSPHRDAAFRAARYAIDETKTRAPIWKAEHFADGHVWIGEPARAKPPATVDGR